MKNEFDINDVWIPHELHPETPAQGQPMTDLFDRFDIDQVTMTCNQRGERYGISFGEMRHLSNTRLALQAAEFAREQGVFHAFHSAVFRAYFTDGKDIGDTAVLLDVGERCGLDRGQLALALEEQRFAGQVAQGSEAARDAGVTALPTFLVEDLPPITGAVSEEAFRKALQKAVERQNSIGDSR